MYHLAPSRLAGILARTDRFTPSLASVVALELWVGQALHC